MSKYLYRFIGFACAFALILTNAVCTGDSPVGPSSNLDLLASWKVGTSLEWDVDMYQFYGSWSHFVGAERWVVESIDNSSQKYNVARFSSGLVTFWMGGGNEPALQVSGMRTTFVVSTPGIFLAIPVNTSIGPVNFPLDTLTVKRFPYSNDAGVINGSPYTEIDSVRYGVNVDNGLNEIYHYRKYTGYYGWYRYHYVLKGISSASKTADYFPRLNVGESSQWSFSQGNQSGPSEITTWTGTMSWVAVAVDSTSNLRTTTIRRVCSGQRMYSYLPRLDSSVIASDTSFFTVKEDGNHVITFAPQSDGKSVSYYGPSIAFDRFSYGGMGNEIEINNDNFQAGSGQSVYLDLNVGLVKYDWANGAGHSWMHVTYARMK
jgi:hypothetical protein